MQNEKKIQSKKFFLSFSINSASILGSSAECRTFSSIVFFRNLGRILVGLRFHDNCRVCGV